MAQDNLQERLSSYDEIGKLGGLGNASSSTGAFVITDAEGKPTVRIGNLISLPGQRGVEVLVNDQWVPVASTASGPRSSPTAGDLLVNAAAGRTVGWIDAGPDVTFQTFTGNVTVLLTATVNQSGYRAASYGSYRLLSGEISPSTSQAIVVGNLADPGMGGPTNSFAYARTHQIAPGTYTLRMAYYGQAGNSPEMGELKSTWSSRTAIVIPN